MTSIASSSQSPTSKTRHVNNLRLSVLEFIETESAYTKYLRILAKSDFQEAIRTKCGQSFNTKRTISERISTTFPKLLDWWTALLLLHEDLDAELQEKCFLRDANNNIIVTASGEKKMHPNSQNYLLSAFAKRAHFLKAYAEYCRLHPIVLELIKEERNESETFDQMVKHFEEGKKAKGLNLSAFLIKPVQRVCKYPLLLRELERNTKKSGTRKDPMLATAIKIVDEAVMAVNTSQHIREETDELITLQESLRPVNFVNLFLNLIRKSRKLIKRGDLKVYRAVPAKNSVADDNNNNYDINNRTTSPNNSSSNSLTPPPIKTNNSEPNRRRSSGTFSDLLSGRRRSSSTTNLSPQKSSALMPISHTTPEDIHLILLSDLLLFTRRVVKPVTLFRRTEKTRYHIAEIISLLDGKVSKTIPPIISEKGLNVNSTFTFTNKAGDMWCIDTIKSPRDRDQWVEAIENIVKSHKELTNSIKATTEKRKSLINNRGSGNIGQMVRPSIPNRNFKKPGGGGGGGISNNTIRNNNNNNDSDKPMMPDRSLKKKSPRESTVTLYCPKCDQKVKSVQGKSILQCHNCKDLFVVRFEKTKNFYFAESIVHHGMLEYKNKTVYALLTSAGNNGSMLRWFKNQEALVKNGCDAALGKIPLSGNTFIRHDDTVCRKINQGGFTIKTEASQRKNGAGRRVSLLRQNYEGRAKVDSFAALNKQTRDLWVNHMLTVIGSNSNNNNRHNDEPEDLLTNFDGLSTNNNSNNGNNNNNNNNSNGGKNTNLSFAERMQMGEDPSKVIAEMYGRRS